MSLLLLGESFQTFGEIAIAVMVLFVHRRVRQEHKIDIWVLRDMRREQWFGIAGILFILLGFSLKVIARAAGIK